LATPTATHSKKTTKSNDRDDNRKFKSEWFTQFTWLEVEEAKDKG
jgi:hypothetical protein